MLGHALDSKREQLERLKGVNVEDMLSILGGKGFANSVQAELMARGGQATQIGRLAGSKLANTALRFVPGLSVAGAALGAADIVAGNDSFGNKAMDTVAMGIGGTLGAMLVDLLVSLLVQALARWQVTLHSSYLVAVSLLINVN